MMTHTQSGGQPGSGTLRLPRTSVGSGFMRGTVILVCCGVLFLWETGRACSHCLVADAEESTSNNYGQDAGERTPQSFEQLKARAQAAMEADRVQDAIWLYTQATKLRPGWNEGWWHLGTLFFDTGKFGPARDAFAQFVRVEAIQPGPG